MIHERTTDVNNDLARDAERDSLSPVMMRDPIPERSCREYVVNLNSMWDPVLSQSESLFHQHPGTEAGLNRSYLFKPV